MHDFFLIEALVYLAAAVIAVPLARHFGLGSVLGYLIAGIGIAPVLGVLGSEPEDLRHVAEFGVVMMLFIVGLELEPRTLWAMRRTLFGLGGAQILLTTALFAFFARFWGFDWPAAIAIGMILSPSSTAIVLQTLAERNHMRSEGGRASVSVLLFQDMAVIPMLAVIPLLVSASSTGQGGAEHGPLSTLPAAARGALILGALFGIYLVGQYLTRPVFRFIAKARIREIFTAAALTIVVSIAVLMELVGLSAALGAFMAGVVLATSEYSHELKADIEPFKGLLLGLFFITVGAGMDFGALFEAPATILGLTIGILALKGAVLFALVWTAGIRGPGGWLVALGLAQAGEFGFVLLGLADPAGALGPETLQALSLSIALTMGLTPLLFIFHERRIMGAVIEEELREADTIDVEGEVIIAGQGRFGQVVNRLLLAQGIRAVVLDNESTQIERLRPFGIKAFFGDPTRSDLLHAAGIDAARALVVAIDQPDQAVRLVEIARRTRPDIHIIARAHDRFAAYALYGAGANEVFREMFESSISAGTATLRALGISSARAQRVSRQFAEHDTRSLEQLAPLWEPGTPLLANEPYLALARQLNSDIERAIEGLNVELDAQENGHQPKEN